MSKKSFKIIWKGTVVGELQEPRVDNFDFYGTWVPSPTPHAKAFLAAAASEDGVEVQVGDEEPRLLGTVDLGPGDQISVRIHPTVGTSGSERVESP